MDIGRYKEPLLLLFIMVFGAACFWLGSGLRTVDHYVCVTHLDNTGFPDGLVQTLNISCVPSNRSYNFSCGFGELYDVQSGAVMAGGLTP